MYDAPPGLKKKEDEKEPETEVKFEWQRKYNAPRELYAKNDEEIRDQPFGIEVRNVRCIKCRKWGHVNTDKICPLFNTDLTAEPPQPSTSAASLLEGMKEDGFKLKQSILGRMAEDPSAEHEKLLDSGDEDDPEVKFLKSLSAKQKKKLLKKLNSLQEGKGKKSKKDKKQKKKKHRSSSSEESEDDSEKKRKKKKKPDSDSETESKKKRKKKKHSSDSDDSYDRKQKKSVKKSDISKDRYKDSNSKERGKGSDKMTRHTSSSPDNRRMSQHSREQKKDIKYNNKRNRDSESTSDSESDRCEKQQRNHGKYQDSRDSGRTVKNRSNRSSSHSPNNRSRRSHDRSTSRDRYKYSKSLRSRSKDRVQRSSRSIERRSNKKHARSSRSRSRSVDRMDRSRNRSRSNDGRRRRSYSRDKYRRSRDSSGSSTSRSRSRDRERSGFVKSGRRSSINTPHVKGWLQSAEIIPGTKDRLGKPRTSVWIVGSSIIYWAHKRMCQLRNINLGMKTSDVYIEWHGTRGMRWNALLPKLMELAKTNRPPDVLILYVGSNDVGYVKPTDLVRMIKTDMSTIKEMYPDTMLIYNEILSRINWRGAPNNEHGEHQRITINKYVKPVMESMGGLMIHHPDIRNINLSLYRDDGVHLNDTGYDIFNNNIGDTIRTVLLRLKM